MKNQRVKLEIDMLVPKVDSEGEEFLVTEVQLQELEDAVRRIFPESREVVSGVTEGETA